MKPSCVAGTRTRKKLSRRECLFRFLAGLFSIALVWGVPEVIVRLSHPVLEQYRGIYFGGDRNSPVLFQTDPRLHWKLRAGTAVTFLDVPVRIDRHGFRGPELSGSGHNVLCLGDSTVFGWRVREVECFPAQLEGLLRSRRPADHWQVLNAGVPGYSSFQVRLQAGRLLRRWRPEVVVICVGNNDAWPALQSDRSLDESGRRVAAVDALVAHSRFLVWAREKVRPQKAQPFVADSLVAAGPRVNREEFAENLRAVARLARQSGARVVLLTPSANPYRPPVMAHRETRQLWCLGLMARIEKGDAAAAFAEIEQALQADPHDMYALWMKGYVLTAAGHNAEGRALFEEALEQHPFPESCKRSYQQVIARIAVEEKTEFVDINEVFSTTAGDRVPGDLFIDHCHPTAEGHRLIAENLVPLVLNSPALDH